MESLLVTVKDYREHDILSASDFNAVMHAARGIDEFYGDTPTPRRPRMVWVKNDDVTDCPLGGVMEIAGKLNFGVSAGYSCKRPGRDSANYKWRYLVSIDRGIPAGGYGHASFLFESGGPVLVDAFDASTVVPKTLAEYGPKNNEWKLFKDGPGFFLNEPIDDTNKLADMTQQIPREVIARVSVGIAEDASGGVQIMYGTPGAESTTGLQLLGVRNDGPTAGANAMGTCYLINGHPRFMPFKCI